MTHLNQARSRAVASVSSWMLPPMLDGSIHPSAIYINKAECGLFGIGEDFLESYQNIDSRFVKNKTSTFFFEAVGDSMRPTIMSGDIVVVDRSLEVRSGNVCIVAYEGQFVCKRVFIYRDHVILKSDNPTFKSIRVDDADSLLYWGVVIARAGEVK